MRELVHDVDIKTTKIPADRHWGKFQYRPNSFSTSTIGSVTKGDAQKNDRIPEFGSARMSALWWKAVIRCPCSQWPLCPESGSSTALP